MSTYLWVNKFLNLFIEFAIKGYLTLTFNVYKLTNGTDASKIVSVYVPLSSIYMLTPGYSQLK